MPRWCETIVEMDSSKLFYHALIDHVTLLNTTWPKKKNHPQDLRREERCSTCDIMLDQERSAQGKVGSAAATVRDFCPALIVHDRAWYHTWNSVLLAANLEDGSFFFLSRVVLRIAKSDTEGSAGINNLDISPRAFLVLRRHGKATRQKK